MIKYKAINHDGKTIIATYSANRAKKDEYDREDKLSTAKKLLKNRVLLKKKPARFFLKSDGKEAYELDENKIENAKKYDRFLAISTNNTTLTLTEILDQYK